MSDIEYKQGDTIPIQANLPADLTQATTLYFEMEHIFSGYSFSNEATILDPEAGEVSYRFSAGETDESGPHNIEWRVEWSNGKIESFPREGYDELYIHEEIDEA